MSRGTAVRCRACRAGTRTRRSHTCSSGCSSRCSRRGSSTGRGTSDRRTRRATCSRGRGTRWCSPRRVRDSDRRSMCSRSCHRRPSCPRPRSRDPRVARMAQRSRHVARGSGPAVTSNTTYGSIDAPRSTRAAYAPTTAPPASAPLIVSSHLHSARDVRRHHLPEMSNEIPHVIEPPPADLGGVASSPASESIGSVTVADRVAAHRLRESNRGDASTARPDVRPRIRRCEHRHAPRVHENRAGGDRGRSCRAARPARRSRRDAALR